MKLSQKIVNWYYSKYVLPYWLVLAIDCVIVMFFGYVAKYLELGGEGFAYSFWQITTGNIINLIPFLISFYCFHTYSGIIRYSSFVDLQRLALATFVGSIASFLFGAGIDTLTNDTDGIEFQGIIGTFILFSTATFAMWIVRVLAKRLFDLFHTEGAIPVAIYGTQTGGISLAKSISAEKEKKYILRLFISDADNLKNTYLLGHKVILNDDELGEKLIHEGIKAILVSPLKSEDFRHNQKMIDSLVNAGIKIMMMPVAEEWDGKSRLSHQQLHEVEIEDLLPREKIEVDMAAIGKMLQNECILITGAAGSIGSEIARQVALYHPKELVLIDQAETPMHDVRLFMASNHKNIHCETIVTSITDAEHMERIFSEYRPDYVFHAAAYKHVPMMEDNPGQAVRNNIYGTRVIADLSVKYGTKKFVMISTDKAVNPTNVMGCSKRICEIYCQALNSHQNTTQFVTTRFGNVLGSNGSVIPIFKEQIKRGGPVMVTHPDIIRYFMLISEACRLVLEAGTMGKGGEIFIFDMGEPVKIVDLAKRMIKLSGAKNVEIRFSGLRDGEKLFEELLNDRELTKPTIHPKIKIANVRKYPYELALRNEEELYELSKKFDDMAIVKKMKEIVPEYKSTNSKYVCIDK